MNSDRVIQTYFSFDPLLAEGLAFRFGRIGGTANGTPELALLDILVPRNIGPRLNKYALQLQLQWNLIMDHRRFDFVILEYLGSVGEIGKLVIYTQSLGARELVGYVRAGADDDSRGLRFPMRQADGFEGQPSEG